MAKKIFKFIFTIFLIYLLIYVFIFQNETKETILSVIELWFTKVVISILPVYVIGSLIMVFPLLSFLLFKVFKKLNLFENQKAISLFLISIIVGNPTSTILISNSYKNKEVTLKQAKLIYGTCSYISPLFLLRILGLKLASTIILSQIISTIIIYVFKANKEKLLINKAKKANNKKIDEVIFEIIDTSPNVLLKILASMLLISIIRIPFNQLSTSNYYHFFLDLFEISTGLFDISQMTISNITKLFMINSIVSLNGFAINLQVFYSLKKEKLTFIPYIKGRIINLVVSTIISLIIFLVF